MTGTDLRGFFDLNVRRQAAARDYQRLFRDNSLDAILMPPAPHTAVPLDRWSTITYTGLWNYLDYPAIVMPVDTVCDSDLVDDLSNAKYGTEDARMYSLCVYSPIFAEASDIMKANLCVSPLYRYRTQRLQGRSYQRSAGWVPLCRRSVDANCCSGGFDYQWSRVDRAFCR